MAQPAAGHAHVAVHMRSSTIVYEIASTEHVVDLRPGESNGAKLRQALRANRRFPILSSDGQFGAITEAPTIGGTECVFKVVYEHPGAPRGALLNELVVGSAVTASDGPFNLFTWLVAAKCTVRAVSGAGEELAVAPALVLLGPRLDSSVPKLFYPDLYAGPEFEPPAEHYAVWRRSPLLPATMYDLDGDRCAKFADLMASLAGGLVRLHGLGFVHGDVKANNVLGSTSEPVLADFGLSRRWLGHGVEPPQPVYAADSAMCGPAVLNRYRPGFDNDAWQLASMFASPVSPMIIRQACVPRKVRIYGDDWNEHNTAGRQAMVANDCFNIVWKGKSPTALSTAVGVLTLNNAGDRASHDMVVCSFFDQAARLYLFASLRTMIFSPMGAVISRMERKPPMDAQELQSLLQRHLSSRTLGVVDPVVNARDTGRTTELLVQRRLDLVARRDGNAFQTVEGLAVVEDDALVGLIVHNDGIAAPRLQVLPRMTVVAVDGHGAFLAEGEMASYPAGVDILLAFETEDGRYQAFAPPPLFSGTDDLGQLSRFIREFPLRWPRKLYWQFAERGPSGLTIGGRQWLASRDSYFGHESPLVGLELEAGALVGRGAACMDGGVCVQLAVGMFAKCEATDLDMLAATAGGGVRLLLSHERPDCVFPVDPPLASHGIDEFRAGDVCLHESSERTGLLAMVLRVDGDSFVAANLGTLQSAEGVQAGYFEVPLVRGLVAQLSMLTMQRGVLLIP